MARIFHSNLIFELLLVYIFICTPVLTETNAINTTEERRVEEEDSIIKKLGSLTNVVENQNLQIDSLTNVVENQNLQIDSIRNMLTKTLKTIEEKMEIQRLDVASLRQGISHRFEETDEKIAWALTDGTLAPKNVSQVIELIEENQNLLAVTMIQLYQIRSKQESAESTAQRYHQNLRSQLSSLRSHQESAKRSILGSQRSMLNMMPFSVNLIGGWLGSGRLYITAGGVELGTLCDDGFGTNEAKVVCRMLGYSTDRLEVGNFYGAGRGSILLDQVSCNGDESHLALCSSNPWGSHDCSHSEDVSIRC